MKFWHIIVFLVTTTRQTIHINNTNWLMYCILLVDSLMFIQLASELFMCERTGGNDSPTSVNEHARAAHTYVIQMLQTAHRTEWNPHVIS